MPAVRRLPALDARGARPTGMCAPPATGAVRWKVLEGAAAAQDGGDGLQED
jgi:hypothetical protein